METELESIRTVRVPNQGKCYNPYYGYNQPVRVLQSLLSVSTANQDEYYNHSTYQVESYKPYWEIMSITNQIKFFQ